MAASQRRIFRNRIGSRLPPEQLADFRWLRIELLSKAVARQLRFEVVQLTGEDRIDEAGIDRLRPDFEPDRALRADLQAENQLLPALSRTQDDHGTSLGVTSLSTSDTVANAPRRYQRCHSAV